MTLSILIPSTPDRQEMFNTLLDEVCRQKDYCNDVHPALGLVSIIWDNSEKFVNGGLSIGQKRDKLLRACDAKYCCYLDDDDQISPDYVETLLRLCNQDKDVCTFRAIAKLKDYWAIIDMGLSHENEQSFPGFVKRLPWHVCPVRIELAKQYAFPDSNYGEDWEWFKNVLKHCGSEANTKSILYQYNKRS